MFQLLFAYVSQRLPLQPSELCLEHLDAPIVMDLLAYLEAERGNSPRTRNTRLTAITSFMRFVEYRVPSILEQSRRVAVRGLGKGRRERSLPLWKPTADALQVWLGAGAISVLLNCF
jgi:hypothetical protein